MAILPIRLFGDPVLREKGRPVTKFDARLQKIADDMIETMEAARGAGLAAPQVGLQMRMFVYDIGEGPGVVVNPELSDFSGTYIYEEGCLSLPGIYVEIERPMTVRCCYRDLDGTPHEIVADELLGRVFQHETDHCDGLFFTLRAEKEKRKEAMRAMRETLMPGEKEYIPNREARTGAARREGARVL